jgi:hypothetical protein
VGLILLEKIVANLIRVNDGEWGDDPHQNYSIAQKTNDGLDVAEDGVRRSYLLTLRQNFQTDPLTREFLLAKDVESLRKHLVKFCHEETKEIFDECINKLLDELKQQSSALLVDDSTGESIMPMTEDMIFYPPNYVDENGQTRKARPVVHPKITSTLALSRYEKHKSAELYKLTKDELAYQHIHNPNSIRDVATQILSECGWTIISLENGRSERISFGQEPKEIQSINPMFHRFESFGRTLARKIRELAQDSTTCDVGPIESKNDQKYRWFEVVVLFLNTRTYD